MPELPRVMCRRQSILQWLLEGPGRRLSRRRLVEYLPEICQWEVGSQHDRCLETRRRLTEHALKTARGNSCEQMYGSQIHASSSAAVVCCGALKHFQDRIDQTGGAAVSARECHHGGRDHGRRKAWRRTSRVQAGACGWVSAVRCYVSCCKSTTRLELKLEG